MLGFLTIIFFFAAVGEGGWFWLIFLVMLVLWGNKKATEKQDPPAREPLLARKAPQRKAPQRVVPPREAPPSPIPPMPTPEFSEEDNANDWVTQLIEICSRYSGDNFYVADLIPQNKLGNVKETYPVPGGGRVIALIDNTVFGSAKDGMAIGTKGISWRNDTLTEAISMTWHGFSKVEIKSAGSDDIVIGDGNRLDMTVCNEFRDKAVELLKAIQSGYSQREELRSKPRPNLVDKVVDIPSASYEELLALPGIGAAEANILLKHHESRENLGSIDEMADLLNLKPHIAERLKARVSFSKSKPQTHVPDTPATPATATPTPPSRPNLPGRGRTID